MFDLVSFVYIELKSNVEDDSGSCEVESDFPDRNAEYSSGSPH